MLKQAVPPIVSNSSSSSSVNNGQAGSASSAIPPLNTLPHWSRVNNLARVCPPKPLLKDRPPQHHQQHPPSTTHPHAVGAIMKSELMASDLGGLDEYETASTESGYTSSRRIFHLEHCVAFLRQQHSEILSALHDEVDRLKRENRDLQFRLMLADDRSLSPVLPAKNSSTSVSDKVSQQSHISPDSTKSHEAGSAVGGVTAPVSRSIEIQTGNVHRSDQTRSGRRPGSRAKLEEQRSHDLEVEVLELRQALKEEKHRSLLLQEQLEQSKSDRSSGLMASLSADSFGDSSEIAVGASRGRIPRPPTHPRPVAIDRLRRLSAVPAVATSNGGGGGSLQVQGIVGTSVLHKQMIVLEPLSNKVTLEADRPLNTVEECHEFIQKLEHENLKQAAELHQLKSDLRDAVYSHKRTPDAILLAKAYVASDTDQSLHPTSRVPLRPTVKKLGDSTYIQQHDSLTLPPMKLTLGAKAVDRHKRNQQQLLSRTRLDHDLLSSHDASDGH